VCRRCKEPDKRGFAKDRRARRRWLLSPEAGHGGDGVTVPCWQCKTPVDYESMEVDRIIPGWECTVCGESVGNHKRKRHEFKGGTYRRNNIRPSCAPDNRERNKGNPWTLGAETRCLTG
jgi:hypothetical protein